MNPLFKDKRIFLVGGPGGVGKTTLAASLAVTFAEAGFRTVVLTVDPARRLAQALGFERFQSELQEIKVAGGGALFASMLDTDRYFDRVIEKFATSPAQREKILNNPLYRTMVENLGGSHEYAAMERLLEFARDASFEKVIVDTPPSDNARELFDAPQRMADFMDGSVLRWFQGGGRIYTQFFKTGTRLAMGALKMVFGGEFLDALGGFLSDLEGMQAGFRGRNLEVLEILRSEGAGFLLVSVPSEARAADCRSFCATLKEKEIPLTRLILNRLEAPAPTGTLDALDLVQRESVSRVLEYQGALHDQQAEWADTMAQLVDCPVVRLPRVGGALHDLSALSRLGRQIVE